MSLEQKIEELTKAIVELNSNIAKIGTETVVEATKEEEVVPKPTPAPKKAPTPKKKPEPKQEITLADLKDSAAKAVDRLNGDRAKVKEIISEFAGKLADVKPEDFGKLYKKLQEA